MMDALEELKRIADKYDMRIKNEGIIKLYPNDLSAIRKALAGLSDIQELAYTTAEHHPYWGILYNAIGIVRVVLENWDKELSNDEIDELKWMVSEISNMLNRFYC